MKKLVVSKEAPCMACLSCVRACSEAFYKVFDPDKSCIQIVDKNGAVKVNTCVQCGKCMRTCKQGPEPQDRRLHDQQKAVHRLRRVRGRLPDEGHDAGRHGHEVHRLRHLRQGVPDGHPLRGGEVRPSVLKMIRFVRRTGSFCVYINRKHKKRRAGGAAWKG